MKRVREGYDGYSGTGSSGSGSGSGSGGSGSGLGSGAGSDTDWNPHPPGPFGTDLTQEQIDNLPPKFRACYDPDMGSGVIGKQCEYWYMGHRQTGICQKTNYPGNEWNGWPRCSDIKSKL